MSIAVTTPDLFGDVSLRVLHTGGSVTDAEAIRAILNASSDPRFELESVRTLAAARQRLATAGINVILLDAQLPDGLGLEALHELLRAAPTVPVIVIGSTEGGGIAQVAMQAGARDYLLASRLDSYWLPHALREAIRYRPSALVYETEHVGATLGLIGTGLVTADRAGGITYLNHMAEALTGWSRSEATGRSLPEVLAVVESSTRARIAVSVAAAMSAEPLHTPSSDCVLLRRDGSSTAIEYSATTLRDPDGVDIGMRIVLRDVSAARAIAMRMSHLASHDPLTDLPNRTLLADRLDRSLTLAHRHQQQLAVLFLDIDHFKSINDTLGHLVGDAVLRRVADTIAKCVRSSDTVSRYGGDEFVVVLAELHHAEDAAKGARKIMTALAQPQTLSGHELWITASIGISVYPGDGTQSEILLTRADEALYHAKQTGRNRYQFSKASLNRRSPHRRSIEAGLHRAFARQEFELVYQPRIDLTTQAMVGIEALLRWRHPNGRVTEPASFLPVATDCGLMGPIGGWVIGEACRQARAWNEAGFRPMPASINLSAKEFRHPGLLQRIHTSLRATPLDPGQLEIELTESVPVADADTTRTLDGLKMLGVPVTLHDLGTGYADLDYFRRCPIDGLKIGRSFVQGATVDAKAAVIVRTMIRLGQSLNARVIAEGVETPEQLAFLQAEHCDQAQGYFFSRPLVPSKIDHLRAHPSIIEDRWSSTRSP